MRSELIRIKLVSNMKFILLIAFFCMSSFAFSQPWQDALKTARASYLSKSYDQAVFEYQIAQKLAPKNVDLSLEIAQTLYKAGKYEEAERLFNSQLNKNQRKVKASDIQRQLGNSRMHQQKYAEAIDAYKNSLRSNPSDEAARHNLGKAIQKKREKEQQQKKQNQQKPNPPDSKDQKPDSDEKEPKDNSQQQKPPTNSSPPKEKQKRENPSLNDKRTERLLDELTEKEKETKRHMHSKMGEKPISSGGTKKDW